MLICTGYVITALAKHSAAFAICYTCRLCTLQTLLHFLLSYTCLKSEQPVKKKPQKIFVTSNKMKFKDLKKNHSSELSIWKGTSVLFFAFSIIIL